MAFERQDWYIRTVAHTILTSSTTHFRIQAELDAYGGDSRIFGKSWDIRIPRRYV